MTMTFHRLPQPGVGGDSHGRGQLDPRSRGTWGQSPAGEGLEQNGGAWEEKRGLSLQFSTLTSLAHSQTTP